jgi:hypothetical protein
MTRPIIIVLLSISTVFLSNCKNPSVHEGLPALYPCKITIIQDRKPLEGATVSFRSEEGNIHWIISGLTNANGVAEMQTHMRYNGVPAGHYKVTVSKNIPESLNTDVSQMGKNTDISASPIPITFRYINAKFDSFKTTPLEINVSKTEGDAETFDVGNPVKEKI